MQVDISNLSPAAQNLFARLSNTPDFYRDLENFVNDNPINIQRGMDWNGHRVSGQLRGNILFITRVS